MYNLTKYEQETIILFNEEEITASVYTYSGKLKRRLASILESGNPDIQLQTEDKRGGVTYVLPKSWIKVNPKRVISEETRQAMSDRFKQMRQDAVLK